MIRARILAIVVAWGVVVTPVISAQETPGASASDLSRYREFRLGMSLTAVTQQAAITAEARAIHRRPELIQELMWLPAPSRVPGADAQGDSATKVLFSFYNDQLFRIVVTYDRGRTEGLTPEDVVEAISATYGLPLLPATRNKSSWRRPRTAATSSSRTGKTRRLQSASFGPRICRHLDWWCSRSGWIRWPGSRPSKRSCSTSKRHRNGKSSANRTRLTKPASSKRPPDD